MRHVALTLILATLAYAGTGAHAATQTAAPTWANEFLKRWYLLYNDGDAPGLAQLFASDARLGADSGRAAIEASLASGFLKTHLQRIVRFLSAK